MATVFSEIAHRTDSLYRNISTYTEGHATEEQKCQAIRDALQAAESSGKRCIFFDGHSEFPHVGGLSVAFSGFRLVRDPRDMIISAAKYHVRSEEAWLHKPQPRFQGLTYAEHIRGLETLEKQLSFEMEQASRNEIRKMLAFDDQGFMKTVKFEDLMEDEELFVFHDLVVALGFSGVEIPRCLDAFYSKSLFGGAEPSAHVQSNGQSQHSAIFTDALREQFQRSFPEALSILGYA